MDVKQKVPKYKAVIHHQELWMLKVDVFLFLSVFCFGCVLSVCRFIVFDFALQSSCTTELVLVTEQVCS